MAEAAPADPTPPAAAAAAAAAPAVPAVSAPSSSAGIGGRPGTEPVGFDTLEMEDDTVFDNTSKELEGNTILEKPRVPRKVIVKSLRQNTISLKKVTNEVRVAKGRITAVEEDCLKIHDEIGEIHCTIAEMKEEIAAAIVRIEEVERQMEEAMKKLEKIDEMEIVLERHTVEIGELQVETKAQKKAFEEYQVVVAAKFKQEAKEREAVATKLGTLWNYVYNELTVTTEQVICGEGEEQTTLTPILKVTEEGIAANAEAIAANKKVLKKHGGQIAEKAGIHVEEVVDEHSKKIKELIEVTGAGGGGARMADLEARIAESTRGVMNIGSIVDDLKEQMLEKCDKSRVDEKIEGKYEEIIDHLQAALSSAGDDEDEFKRVSMELQEICRQLSSSKADKRDLLELKEQVLFDSRVREQVEQLKEFLEDKMDKNECASSLEMKPDRSEMQKLLSDLKKTMSAQMKKVVAAAEDGDEVDGVGGGGGPGEAMISTSSVAPATQSTSIDNRVSRSSPSSRSRGGPTGRGSTGGNASNGSAGYGEKKHMYANLVWKKGKMPAPKPLVNANPEAIKVAYGGGYSMALGSDSQGPPLRQGHSAEVLPKLQRPPPPNPRTGFVVGVDGLIYHGASLDSATSRPAETSSNQEQDAPPLEPAEA